MGDRLTYDELFRAFREMEEDRDRLLAAVHEQTVEIERLRELRERLRQERTRWYEAFRRERRTRDQLRQNISKLSKQLHHYTGK